jgi:hypothetical protein
MHVPASGADSAGQWRTAPDTGPGLQIKDLGSGTKIACSNCFVAVMVLQVFLLDRN